MLQIKQLDVPNIGKTSPNFVESLRDCRRNLSKCQLRVLRSVCAAAVVIDWKKYQFTKVQQCSGNIQSHYLTFMYYISWYLHAYFISLNKEKKYIKIYKFGDTHS